MNYRSIQCDSLLKKITKKDTLFQGDYCVDPYHNCAFRCSYCDSSFEDIIYVKTNAVEIFRQELSSVKKGMVIIGSVHDPYQPVEKTYELTRGLLQVLQDSNFSCHILTKSPLVLRDIDLLTSLRCLVTVSIISLDPQVSRIFEQDTPSPNHRLETVHTLIQEGIHTGIAMIPVVPYITDEEGEHLIQAASQVKVQYFLHKYLELKGDQKLLFEKILHRFYPQFLSSYKHLYQDNIKPVKSYRDMIDKIIKTHCKTYKISEKISV